MAWALPNREHDRKVTPEDVEGQTSSTWLTDLHSAISQEADPVTREAVWRQLPSFLPPNEV